ncbi:MAG: glycosyltransferase family 9 protein [Saprospiraceae bacterium]|nr:glycosyltransferase family 9 protein [Saprospiraceae bacterium]
MKILIIRFSSIGDIVLTTPVIRCLKQQLDAEIHFATKKQYTSLLSSNPYIDRIYGLGNKLESFANELKKNKYDYIIDLHKNLRSWYLCAKLRTKTFRFYKLNAQKWLLTKFKINFLPQKHIVDRYLEAVAPLDVKNDGQGLDFFIDPQNRINIKQLHTGLLPNQFVCFVIGAAHKTKQLPSSKIISVCKEIKRPILLIGGPNDSKKGQKIKGLAGTHVINLCGLFNIQQSADIIRQARTIITHDTGMMHIAAAFNKEIISVWGNTVPEFGMYPYYSNTAINKNTTIQVKDLSCRPCSKIGYNECPKKHFKCMKLIREDEILQEFESWQ